MVNENLTSQEINQLANNFQETVVILNQSDEEKNNKADKNLDAICDILKINDRESFKDGLKKQISNHLKDDKLTHKGPYLNKLLDIFVNVVEKFTSKNTADYLRNKFKEQKVKDMLEKKAPSLQTPTARESFVERIKSSPTNNYKGF